MSAHVITLDRLLSNFPVFFQSFSIMVSQSLDRDKGKGFLLQWGRGGLAFDFVVLDHDSR